MLHDNKLTTNYSILDSTLRTAKYQNIINKTWDFFFFFLIPIEVSEPKSSCLWQSSSINIDKPKCNQ